jgi:N-acetyl-gamma-glutamyl-phosphate reductase
MKISICGATGYTGEELLRILASHPQAEVVHITSENQTGADINSVYPHFGHIYHQMLTSMEQLDVVAKDSDVVFIALPHGHAMDAVKTITGHGKKVIDLGADYRFADTSVYEKWYKVPHTHKDSNAVYGLTELFREKVKQAKILANPGCYTTASILALTPLVKNGLVATDSIIVDAKSGISGAGRGLNQTYHYAEATENLKAYNIGGHRHTPEIEQALSEFASNEVVINFTPHLIPMVRGILATCYANLKPGVSAEQVDDAFVSHYDSEYFIRLLGRGGYPATKNTRGSNFCDIGWHVDKRTGRVIVVSALDNLVKGAAGQAVQNMNVMFGMDERTGLTQVPLYL